MPILLTADKSNVLVNGKAIEGLQEITYRTVKPHIDLPSIGSDERMGIAYGMTEVRGYLRVISASDDLDQLFINKTPFQIFAQLKHTASTGDMTKEITLDDCYMHKKSFALKASGVAEVIYKFSATRER
ncbi:hypothetical protein ACFPVX_22835 [Cohnella faecalis]|uniref:Phage tail protein n=1 Tax=Cohnella faecalis TaxID=2315694 RepID=A0A398CI22_9BACL|nr:hypothetical protein [Cohnella faecalis]RIE02443.1 hypothetical protein D3H35_17210 [Cohnella faecalis]